MTVGVSSDWELAQTGPWLVAPARSCAVHAAFVWERRTFPRPSGREPATSQDNTARGAAKTGVSRFGPRRAAYDGLQTEF